MKAVWNGAVLAASDDTVVVEGNHYFPRESMDTSRFKASDTRTRCAWKGEAHYFHVEVDGQVNRDAAWYYPEPLHAARAVQDRVAFWRGVQVIE